jgi:peptide/nickel transport system substrate-binding protein
MMPKNFRSRWLVSGLILILAITLTACGVGIPLPLTDEQPDDPVPAETEAPPATKEKTLVVSSSTQSSDTFDISTMSYAMEPITMVYDSLISVDTNGQFQPGALTERYSVSNDGKVVTFYLQKGITFHDGSDFNAEVVKWNIELVQTGEGCCAYLFTPITEMVILNDYAIELHMDGPFPGLLFNLSSAWGLMMSKAKYEECGENYGLTPECVSGTGPFILQEWNDQVDITLVKNPEYNWAATWTGHVGPANVDRIINKFIAEDVTRLMEMERGETHLMMEASWLEAPKLVSDPAYQVVDIPDATLYYILMPLFEPLLADLNTRYGIGYAIDRDLIKITLFVGIGAAKTTYLASEVTADKGVVGPGYDPTMAATKFAEAGWAMRSDGILVAESVQGVAPGTRFEIELTTYQTDEAQRVAEAVQAMLADVGIVMSIVTMDDATYSDTLRDQNFQMGLRRYTWDNADILPWFLHSQYIPFPNYTGVNDPWLDNCMDDADYNSATWAERDSKYAVCQQYIIDTHYPWAPIYQRPELWFARDFVSNLTKIPLRAGSSTEVWLLMDLPDW